MEHIRQYDWCALLPDTQYFVTEQELDNCVTEKILQNKFCNPLVSSDSEDEGKGPKFDWDVILKRRNHEQNFHRIYVPGLRPSPVFTRLSALTTQQHHQCLKVLCAQNPSILEDEFMARPTKFDQRVFETLKEVYQKEQQEFIEWAKTLWINGQCIRALRPKPIIETVYEAEFKLRANQMKDYPKVFEVVAQIPLESSGEFDMVMEKELIGVSVEALPYARWPVRLRSRLALAGAAPSAPSAPAAPPAPPAPVPCDKHPVRFLLPNEQSFTVLPITEVNRELAHYTAGNGAQFIASEGALRCLASRRAWALPVSVFSVPAPDGGSSNVIVLGSEFLNKQENVLTRTFRALRHLLEFALVPASEVSRAARGAGAGAAGVAGAGAGAAPSPPGETRPAPACPSPAADNSDDEDNLVIDFDEDAPATEPDAVSNHSTCNSEPEMEIVETDNTSKKETETKKESYKNIEGFGVYNCTCKDSVFERPPPRSFRKWQFRNNTTSEHFDVIVHCAHKFRGSSGEILLEPIPEYQSDLGASKQNEDRLTSLAFSLALRENASVLNVRLDALSGDVITLEEFSREKFLEEHGDRRSTFIKAVHTALGQIQGLVPGHYVIQHEPSHGDNALLYAPRNTGEEQQLRLQFDCAQPAEADEARSVRAPPTLTPALLPCHKFRKMLPCTFTHYATQLVKPQKQPARKKTPPRALKWPKKRGRKPKAD